VSDDLSLGSEQTGFLDVAANALAVMILATMMLLIVAAPIRISGEVIPDESTPELNFPTPSDPVMRPLYAYYLVTSSGIVSIDLDALTIAAAEAGGSAQTDQGRLRITVPRSARRDWNQYRARFLPDIQALRTLARPITENYLSTLVDHLREDYEKHRIVTTWLVVPDGIETAAPVYWGLRGAGVPVRWHITDQDSEIIFGRSAELFEQPGALD